MEAQELRLLINKEEIDINTQEIFVKNLLGGVILFLNKNISIRNKRVPHYFISTGDDTLYKELLEYSFDKTYLSVTGENFVYSECPRCILDYDSLEPNTSQLSQPFTPGRCVITSPDHDEYEFTAEFRRMPLTLSLKLKYYLDTFHDSLYLQQLILTKLSFVRTFRISYLGQEIECAIKFPENTSIQKNIEVDFGVDSKEKSIELDLEIISNIPIYNNKTAVESSLIITQSKNNISTK